MVVSMRVAVAGLLWGLLGCCVCGAAPGQEAPGGAPTAPAPAEAPQQARPQATYGPLQAAQDAYQMAEQQRRWAIDRQLGLLDDVKRYNTWIGYGMASLPEIYAYGSPWAARRAYRRGYGPLFTPWPLVPGDVYGYPYYPWVRQPIGHEKIWTGPNGYIYVPRYAAPGPAPGVPMPAAPSAAMPGSPAPPQQPPPAASSGNRVPQPAWIPSAAPPPETIPTPPIEPGPREF